MRHFFWLLLFLSVISCKHTPKSMNPMNLNELNQQVFEIENAFAQTMVDRNFVAFTEFIAEDAVFFAGNQPLRGKEAILQAWRPYYQNEAAPFSWQAEVVEVYASGDLALSNGPVYDSQGELFARFNSVWKKQENGKWQVIFDKGTSMHDLKKEEPNQQ